MRRHLNGGESRPSTSATTNNIKRVKNFPTYSSSQLSIKVSELHADKNGRLEITCLSTIPASIGPGGQFADFKSYSVKSKRRHLYSLIFQGWFGIGSGAWLREYTFPVVFSLVDAYLRPKTNFTEKKKVFVRKIFLLPSSQKTLLSKRDLF